LFEADYLHVGASHSNYLDVAFTNAWHGTATAIDLRGYFLTAAHCVKKGPLWVAFLMDGSVKVQPARLVWRGDIAEQQPDLAILQVSTPLQQAFEWATEYTNGNSAVAVGLSLDKKSGVLKTQCMAGKLLNVSEKTNLLAPSYTIVSHNVPLRRGDSGGPLVSTNGCLLGINVRWIQDFQWSHLSLGPPRNEADRPDLKWLQQIIDQDAALQSRSLPNKTLR
jgi:S1-C subfamily serine protease